MGLPEFERIWGAWRGGAGMVMRALAPMRCQVCHGVAGEEPWCGACRSRLMGDQLCPRCATVVERDATLQEGCGACRGKKMGVRQVIALGEYSDVLRELCFRLKQRHHAWLSRWLVELLWEARGLELGTAGIEAVAPIPLHWWRRWVRGYDQAEELAEAVARRLGVPMVRAMRRRGRTPHLVGLSASERRLALRGVFAAERRRGELPRSVWLVDDILTTGATCRAAAACLRRQGVREVGVIVIAKAGTRVP